jgi:pimeloyl-ACP methyl ester carboxylesterase
MSPNARVDGPEEGTPLVLVHGLVESLRVWERIVPLLADRFRIVRVDLQGFGDSPPPPESSGWSIEDQARAVRETLAELGVGPAVLVGHSMGGSVITSMALQDAACASALVLINAPPAREARMPGRTELALRLPVIGKHAWAAMDDRVRRVGLQTAFAPAYEVPDVFVRDMARTSHATFRGSTVALDAFLAASPLASCVARLGKPCAVIVGMLDLRVDVRAFEPFGAIPGTIVHRLLQAGHSPMWEEPELTAELIAGVAPAQA